MSMTLLAARRLKTDVQWKQEMDSFMTSGAAGGGFALRLKPFRDRRGAVSILAAFALPALAGFAAMGIEVNHIHYEKMKLEQTVQSAALAGANKITTYYTYSGSATCSSSGTNPCSAIVAEAQAIASANMPAPVYGTVVPAANVVVGNWNASTSTFTSLASSGGTTPNAVEVIALETKANGNPIVMFFGALVGYATYDATATAVASYGTGQTFNTIVINDLSKSFESEISAQQAADSAILNCIASASGSNSQFGITTIDGSSSIFEPLTTASTNTAAIQSKINSLNYCGTSGMPACTGSNVASGIYSAIQQFSGSAYANSRNNIIVITDGAPSVSSSMSYALANGIGPTLIPLTLQVCIGSTCTDADLLKMAQNQAAAARAANISISTIFYTGDTTASSSACTSAALPASCTTAQLTAQYAADLASLTGGTGISLQAPTATTISSTFAAFCATMASSIKQVTMH